MKCQPGNASLKKLAEADGTSLRGGPEVKRKTLLLRPFGRISHGACEKCGLETSPRHNPGLVFINRRWRW